MSCRGHNARLFFALDPDAETRARLASLQARMKVSARPVPAANLHITLAFLGSVPLERTEGLLQWASNLSMPVSELRLNRTGWFERAQVFWLGATQTPEALSSFQARLCERLLERGFAPDRRRWLPHITLYRKMRKPCEMIDFEPVLWPVRSFSLMRSNSTENGPVYEVLGQWEAVG